MTTLEHSSGQKDLKRKNSEQDQPHKSSKKQKKEPREKRYRSADEGSLKTNKPTNSPQFKRSHPADESPLEHEDIRVSPSESLEPILSEPVALEDVASGNDTATAAAAAAAAHDAPKRSKKKKKKARATASSTVTLDSHAKPSTEPNADSDGGVNLPDAPNTTSAASEPAPTNTKHRFIVFAGNLPYSTTHASLTAHFARIKPASIRHITRKDDPATSKGYAFIEFDDYDRMRTCLKLYHHSTFDDGVTAPRRINVELTAGGGGKGQGRREKLRAKNVKLAEQRKRRDIAEKEARGKDGRRKGSSNADHQARGSDAAEEDGVHPSRRDLIKT